MAYIPSDATITLQHYEDVDDEAEARKRGFPKGSKFKLLKFDFVLVTNEESKAALEQQAKAAARNAVQ